jgi:hypothetical protein
MTERFRIALALAAFWGLSGCARVIAPEGGPKDLVAPVLQKVAPDSGATNVGRSDPMVLEFSEWVDPATVRAAVSLMPAPARAPEILVDGPRVTIRLREPLDSATTSVLRLGAGIADFRGAALVEAREIPFSTGAALDSGTLAVRAWIADDSSTPRVARGRVGLYALDSSRRAGLSRLLRRKDSTAWLSAPPSPWREKAWRWAQTDSLGVARFTHLGPGRWRVVAWEDPDKDGYWRPGEENVAWVGDLVWTAAAGRDTLWARLSRLDTLSKPDSVKSVADTAAPKRARRRSDSLGVNLAEAAAARLRDDSLARRRDSLALHDSLRLDSLEARDRALSEDSLRTLELAGIPPGWTERGTLRLRLFRLDQKRRPRLVLADRGIVKVRVPRGGKWGGEVWLDEDRNGLVAVGDPFRRTSGEPWRPLSVLSDDPADESATLRLSVEPFQAFPSSP